MNDPFRRFNTTLEKLDNREQATRMANVVSGPTILPRAHIGSPTPGGDHLWPQWACTRVLPNDGTIKSPSTKRVLSPKTNDVNQAPSDGFGRPRSGRSKRRSFSTTTGTPASANAD